MSETPTLKILMPERYTLTKGDVDLSAIDELGEVIVLDHPSREELKEALVDADMILVNKTVLDEEVLRDAKKLKYIGECATGFNNIDIEYCKLRGITVTNVPTYSSNAVAQQVFSYILAHYSKVCEYNDFVNNDGWINADTFAPFVFDTDEVFGKTIGLVGYGKIGKAVAKIADAFGMNVLAYTRSYQKALDSSANKTTLEGFIDRAERYVTFVTFDRLLKHSDIVSIHCPLNEESERLFNRETIAKMRNGAFLINTARGPIVDEDALVDALESGKLSGAGLDVLDDEPMLDTCRLKNIKNLIVTPHVAWAPYETRKRLVAEVAKNIKAFEEGKPRNVVV
ncbi:MAG: D-2-hydroxyacid dehydrogenase [Ruminococcaceae bacterium]|nr:D-2-hydroxyacid dehydrogenase [Oscillospiraceae bacterium]